MLRILTVVTVLFSSSVFADLNVGDSAPELKIEKWLKGTPVEKFESGRIYIVEFWGTWCPPCVKSIPHLSEIAKKYGSDVTVIGIAASESEKTGLAGVEAFLEKNDPSMDYIVAFDSTGETKKLWMDAAKRLGIPSSFVVDRNGVIAYIGHPGNLEEEEFDNPLKLILAGTWQKSEKLAKYHLELREKAEAEYRVRFLSKQLISAKKKEDWLTVYSLAMQGAWLPDSNRWPFVLLKAEMLIKHLGRPESGLSYLKEIIDNKWEHAQMMGHVARLLVDDNMPLQLRSNELNKRVADRALELAINNPDEKTRARFSKYAYVLLPPIAEYYFKAGRPDLAVDLQDKALKNLPDDNPIEGKEKLEKDLAKYNEAFEKSKKIVATSIAAAPKAIVCEGGVCYIPAGYDDCEKKLK